MEKNLVLHNSQTPHRNPKNLNKTCNHPQKTNLESTKIPHKNHKHPTQKTTHKIYKDPTKKTHTQFTKIPHRKPTHNSERSHTENPYRIHKDSTQNS